MKTTVYYFFGLLLLLSNMCCASEEGVLPVAQFHFQSPGIDGSGPITIDGSKDNEGHWSEIGISAFGKTFSAGENILKEIKAPFINGILLSYEAGYPETGGRTVYISLLTGFTSGVQRMWILSISEDGTITLHEQQEKKA